jgi:RNA polymerase sigma-70 factor (ECF subfamily)
MFKFLKKSWFRKSCPRGHAPAASTQPGEVVPFVRPVHVDELRYPPVDPGLPAASIEAIVRSQHDLIEEIINDTLWTVWQKAGDFRGASRVSTWIVGIAYRRALKTLRQAKQTRTADSSDLDTAEAGEVQVHDDDRQWLQLALAELPLEQRLVLEFAYLMGHSCEEIAEIMQCPVNTVKTRMFHARQKLRLSLPRLAGLPPVDV